LSVLTLVVLGTAVHVEVTAPFPAGRPDSGYGLAVCAKTQRVQIMRNRDCVFFYFRIDLASESYDPRENPRQSPRLFLRNIRLWPKFVRKNDV